MNSVTLTYDSNDAMAQKVIDFVLSLNLFKAQQKTTIPTDPTCMTKEEFFTKLDRAEAQYKRGECHTRLQGESMEQFLERVG